MQPCRYLIFVALFFLIGCQTTDERKVTVPLPQVKYSDSQPNKAQPFKLETRARVIPADRLAINTGTTGNDGTGDTLRGATGKINTNFIELYANLTTVSNIAVAGGSAVTKVETNNGTAYGLTLQTAVTNAHATANRVLILDSAKRQTNSTVTDTELALLSGKTSLQSALSGLPGQAIRLDSSAAVLSTNLNFKPGYHTNNTPVIVIPFGDSTISGTGSSSATNNAFGRLFANYLSAVGWIHGPNRGTPGDDISDMEARRVTDVNGSIGGTGTNTVVLIRVGINDIRAGATAAATFAALSNIVTLVKTNARTQAIIATLHGNFETTTTNMAQVAIYNQMIRDHGASFADGVYDSDFLIPRNQLFFDKDGLHLNDAGYDFDGYGWNQTLIAGRYNRYPLAPAVPLGNFNDGFNPNGDYSTIYPGIHGSDFDTGIFFEQNRMTFATGTGPTSWGLTQNELYPLNDGVSGLGRSGLRIEYIYLTGGSIGGSGSEGSTNWYAHGIFRGHSGVFTNSLTLNGNSVATAADHLGFFAATTSLQLKNNISDETGSGALVFGTSPTIATPVFTTSMDIGTAGVRVTEDGDGAITFLGLGNGSDEDLTLNFDDTSNTIAVSSSTGVTAFDFGSIDALGPNDDYDATNWNGSREYATKDDIRDKIESMSGGGISGLTTGTVPVAASATTIADGPITITAATNGAISGTFSAYAFIGTGPVASTSIDLADDDGDHHFTIEAAGTTTTDVNLIGPAAPFNGIPKFTVGSTTNWTISAATVGTDVLDSTYISDTAFAGSWNGVTTIAPTKNAVHDWGITFDADLDGLVDKLDASIEIGGTTDTTITRSAAGIIAVEGVDQVNVSATQTLTGKTFDAAGTGNVFKMTGYQDFVYPSRVDGTGTTISTDSTSALWGLATSSGTADTNGNYAIFRIGTVPYDLDTSVAMTLKGFSIRVSGTDTDAAEFAIALYSPASSSAYSPSDFTALSTYIHFDSGALTSPAANDIFYFSDVTLTGWAAALTAGRPFIIGIARRNGSNDDSVTILSGTIAFGRTQ